MKQFWQYVQANPRTISPVSDRTAYVLPADYAYGFRGPEDKIWGLWNADTLTLDISMSVATLLQMDGNNLDIVYPSQTLESAGYHSIIYWNNTRLIPTPSCLNKHFLAVLCDYRLPLCDCGKHSSCCCSCYNSFKV